MRRFDGKREEKTSNEEWLSSADVDSRVAKMMKDVHTHLACKAEHALDAESELVVAAVNYRADARDAKTLPLTLERARMPLGTAGGAEAGGGSGGGQVLP